MEAKMIRMTWLEFEMANLQTSWTVLQYSVSLFQKDKKIIKWHWHFSAPCTNLSILNIHNLFMKFEVFDLRLTTPQFLKQHQIWRKIRAITSNSINIWHTDIMNFISNTLLYRRTSWTLSPLKHMVLNDNNKQVWQHIQICWQSSAASYITP